MKAFFGRTELEWEELEAVGWEVLLDCTVALTTYSELNTKLAQITGQPPMGFRQPSGSGCDGASAGSLGRP